MKTRVLELNSSDERGINVIREKVKTFSQFTASGHRSDGKPCPPFKIVILDEADSMTSAAQVIIINQIVKLKYISKKKFQGCFETYNGKREQDYKILFNLQLHK